jgi:hypothetical protein
MRKEKTMNEHPAPNWVNRLIETLQALWPLDRPLQVVLADDAHLVWAMHDNYADGACNIRPEQIVIFLRSHAFDGEAWRDILIHEYTHAAMASLLYTTPGHEAPLGIDAYRADAYIQAVENVTQRVAGLLDYAVRTHAQARKA